jgi:hypothetical protein
MVNRVDREKIIQNYMDGYNAFDVDKMVADFDDRIIFLNIQDGAITLSLEGVEAFRLQAEIAKSYFTTRQQTIRSFTHTNDTTEVALEYKAVLATDFPNGMKQGQELQLNGKSVFHFADTKIIKLTDIS